MYSIDLDEGGVVERVISSKDIEDIEFEDIPNKPTRKLEKTISLTEKLEDFITNEVWNEPWGMRMNDLYKVEELCTNAYVLALRNVKEILNNDETTMYNPVLLEIDKLVKDCQKRG